MKRMYFVNGRNVTVSGSANMSKEELKKLIIEQVEKMMPEQADMVKQNIDQAHREWYAEAGHEGDGFL